MAGEGRDDCEGLHRQAAHAVPINRDPGRAPWWLGCIAVRMVRPPLRSTWKPGGRPCHHLTLPPATLSPGGGSQGCSASEAPFRGLDGEADDAAGPVGPRAGC